MDAARRKAPNPNKDPELLAEKKAAKAERDKGRKRADEIKRMSWKYGLGSAAVITGECVCSLSLSLSLLLLLSVVCVTVYTLKHLSRTGLLCTYSLFTISRATIVAVQLDDATQLKEVCISASDCALPRPCTAFLLCIISHQQPQQLLCGTRNCSL